MHGKGRSLRKKRLTKKLADKIVCSDELEYLKKTVEVHQDIDRVKALREIFDRRSSRSPALAIYSSSVSPDIRDFMKAVLWSGRCAIRGRTSGHAVIFPGACSMTSPIPR
jgi:hypothetical protein